MILLVRRWQPSFPIPHSQQAERFSRDRQRRGTTAKGVENVCV